MFRDFRDFIAKGNVLNLAVAVIIGAAFATIVASMTDDLIMPIIGSVFGGLDFSSHYLALAPIPEGVENNYVALKAAGIPVLGYGKFLTVLVAFLILAFIIFMLVKVATRMMRAAEEDAGPSEEVLLLRDIRDSLKSGARRDV